MMWCSLLILSLFLGFGSCINRPVYKVVLAQKGFAQFLQYDVETPPLREFTFCIWIRLYELLNDQTIFTYVVKGNNRIVRLWLDSGGYNMKISIDGRITSSTPVGIVKDVWRHVCLSYQSNYGAWALYLDARLVSCEASQSVYGFVLPEGGSVLVGYGTAENGAANGFEGEVFGANMILTSTIEKNYTTKQDPFYDQKTFQKNKLKDNNSNIRYLVLSDLQTDEIHNNFEKTQFPGLNNTTTSSFIKFRTPHSFIEHSVGTDLMTTSYPGQTGTSSIETEILGFTVSDKIAENNDQSSYWSVPNDTENNKKFKTHPKSTLHPRIGTKDYFTISEFETPPPLGLPSQAYFNEKSLEFDKIPATESIYNIKEVSKKYLNHKFSDELSEMETPPPLDKNTKVYGQWTSSKFAGNVLNYLKSINYKNRDQRKVPATLPDSFPYASDFKVNKVRTPNFQRRNLIEKFEGNKKLPQINVQILEDDLRSNIIKSHAQAKPKHVEIVNRGESKKNMVKRFYRNVNSQESVENFESAEEVYKPKPFSIPNSIKKKMKYPNLGIQNKNFMSILPFLKSLEYFVDDSQKTESKVVKNDDTMHTKSLPNGNKWHNVKSYSNDYTPRKINFQPDDERSNIDYKLPEASKKHPSVKLKYKYEDRKLVENKDDERILKGRELAMKVSNQSDHNKDSVSILKYNHGYLPVHDKKVKKLNRVTSNLKSSTKQHRPTKNSFNKQVKIGNALNERHVIGDNEEQKIQSFVGDETIPDINRYRSDNDNGNIIVPPSLGPRECKNVELYDRVLYVQPDESIDMTHILSPVRAKNIGIEFIIQNYKKCSLAESTLENNVMLFIDWSKTPVRLFGGAFPKTTTDLCGFFK